MADRHVQVHDPFMKSTVDIHMLQLEERIRCLVNSSVSHSRAYARNVHKDRTGMCSVKKTRSQSLVRQVVSGTCVAGYPLSF